MQKKDERKSKGAVSRSLLIWMILLLSLLLIVSLGAVCFFFSSLLPPDRNFPSALLSLLVFLFLFLLTISILLVVLVYSRVRHLEQKTEAAEAPSDTRWEAAPEASGKAPDPPVKETGRREQYRYVERAQEFIQERYADNMLSLDVVSEHLGISSPYLSSLMTRSLSMGFSEYLNRCRVEKARELLENSSLSITEVSEQTGFSSLQNFGRVFKKYNGESAGQFRKRMLEQQHREEPEKTKDG